MDSDFSLDSVLSIITNISTTYGPALNLLSAVAVLLSAVFALGLLKSTKAMITSNRDTARKRATLDLILHNDSNARIQTNRADYVKLVRSEERLAKQFMDEDSNNRIIILRILNDFEFIAAGINSGIIDEEFYKMCSETNFVTNWNKLRTVVSDIRETKEKDTFFVQFEILAVKWGGKPIGK
ncbi:MAG: DUF4760 domain-containing protein [Sneathiella sp.]